MRAGTLNRLVKIQRADPEAGRDSIGQPIPGWADVAQVWANIAVKSGLEVAAAGTEVSAARYSIRIRYRPGLTADMTVLHGPRRFRIEAVLNDESGRDHTDLVCLAVESDG